MKKLDEGKFPIQQISVVAKDIQDEKKVHGYVTACDVSKSGAKTGAWMGGLFGALVSAAFIWVPGVGLAVVAGSLSAALLGGVEGALAGSAMGGILSGLAGWGISKQHILKYEESSQGGKLSSRCPRNSRGSRTRLKSLLQGTGARRIECT